MEMHNYFTVQTLGSISMISICTWWVKNVCCLYCPQYFFCTIVLKSRSRITSWSCSVQFFFSVVDKMFQHFFFTFVNTDRQISHTKKKYILTLRKHVRRYMSSRDEEFRIFKFKVAKLKLTKTVSASFSTIDV